MKRKKWSYFYLTIILVFSVFIAACSSDKEEVSNLENNEPSENFNPEGFPIVNEPITVSIMGAKHALVGDWEKLQLFEEMEKLTNIQFEYNEIPVSDYEEKKNLAFASGEIPELFFGARLTADDEMKYGQQGILIPLEGLIEKYAPNIQKVFDENPENKKISYSARWTYLCVTTSK